MIVLSLGMMSLAFVIATVAGIFVIPFLHQLKFGQEIREEGPAWHKSKSGTPTMGGFIFMIAMVLGVLFAYFVLPLMGIVIKADIFILLVGALGFGAVGFLDDYIKVILKRNLGLKAAQKFSLQIIVSLLISVWLVAGGFVDTSIIVPFTKGLSVNLGWFYIPFIIIVMLATVNSVNLTDGLDGLATSITVIVSICYMLIARRVDSGVVAVFASLLAGGLLGFLLYNAHPAKVFMGDTGSLFLGGAVSVMAIYMRMPITLLIIGLVYVCESLSVIIQVGSFKLTGKRVFKMSPIHHHFEMCGWGERRIVAVFSLATAIVCLLGYLS